MNVTVKLVKGIMWIKQAYVLTIEIRCNFNEVRGSNNPHFSNGVKKCCFDPRFVYAINRVKVKLFAWSVLWRLKLLNPFSIRSPPHSHLALLPIRFKRTTICGMRETGLGQKGKFEPKHLPRTKHSSDSEVMWVFVKKVGSWQHQKRLSADSFFLGILYLSSLHQFQLLFFVTCRLNHILWTDVAAHFRASQNPRWSKCRSDVCRSGIAYSLSFVHLNANYIIGSSPPSPVSSASFLSRLLRWSIHVLRSIFHRWR